MSNMDQKDAEPEASPPVSDDELEAAAPRTASRRELWVGLLTIVGVAAAVFLLLKFTNASMFRQRYRVTTTVRDAGGLRNGDAVQMRGVNIGRVYQFTLLPEGVKITLELEGRYQVPADSSVVLKSAGLMGGRIADVIPGRSRARLRNGMELRGEAEGGEGLTADELAESAKRALAQVNAVLSPTNVQVVGQSAQELQETIEELSAIVRAERTQVARLTESLNRSAQAVEDATARGQLQDLTRRMNETMVRIDATSSSLDRASTSLEIVLGRVERGEGTLGRLATDDELYCNLRDAAAHLDQLVVDIRQHPGRYVTVKIF